MRPYILTRTLLPLSVNGVALLQTLAGVGDLTLNGALAVNVTSGYPSAVHAEAHIGDQQHVTLTSANNLSAVNFTIYGTNYQGQPISEVHAGPNANTVNLVLNYATVTRVAASAAAAAVSVGILGTGESQPLPLDIYVPNSWTNISLEFTGAANVSVQFTNDNPFNKREEYGEQGYTPPPVETQGLLWFPHPVAGLTGAAANVDGATETPMRAVRLVGNSGAGTVRMTVTQQSTL